MYVQLAVAFINVKFHLPGEFPLDNIIKVSLQNGVIVLGFDAAVEDAIISKETYCAIDGFVGEVIAIVWVQEQCIGAHKRGQDGERIATLQKQLSAISLSDNYFESRYVWFL